MKESSKSQNTEKNLTVRTNRSAPSALTIATIMKRSSFRKIRLAAQTRSNDTTGENAAESAAVVDRGQFKSASREGLVKKTVRIAGSRIDVYFTADELHEKYPDTPILIANSDWSGYEGLIIRKEGNNND